MHAAFAVHKLAEFLALVCKAPIHHLLKEERLTVREYWEPLSVLSRRARSSSLSMTPFLEHTRHLSISV